ncbi:MAG: hypothetical protein II943_04330 [Victivallales bacterium]|nr:hypothetical protein [Victivallales bacterium]
MSFEFTCPFCNQAMQCEDEWRGMQAQCPTCGKSITLNPPGQMAAQPVLPPQESAMPSAIAANASSSGSGGILGKIFTGVGVVIGIAIAIFIYATFFDKLSEGEIIKTSKELVEQIIEREVRAADVKQVDIQNFTEVSENHYRATAYISAFTPGEGEERGCIDIKIEVKGDYVEVEAIPGTYVDLTP